MKSRIKTCPHNVSRRKFHIAAGKYSSRNSKKKSNIDSSSSSILILPKEEGAVGGISVEKGIEIFPWR